MNPDVKLIVIDEIGKMELFSNRFRRLVRNALNSDKKVLATIPLGRMYSKKKPGKRRFPGIPTMRDRGMQALYSLALAPVSEKTADLHSYGLRESRSCTDAI